MHLQQFWARLKSSYVRYSRRTQPAKEASNDAPTVTRISYAPTKPARLASLLSEYYTVDQQFGRFLELPTEIRKMIYNERLLEDEAEILYGTYRNDYVPPVEPPVTRASRQLRDEALPIFYETWRFPLSCTSYDPTNFYFKKRWFDRLPGHKLAWVQTFMVHIPCGSGLKSTFFTYHVRVDLRRVCFIVVPTNIFGEAAMMVDDSESDPRKHLEGVLARVAQEPGIQTLDVKAFEQIVRLGQHRER